MKFLLGQRRGRHQSFVHGAVESCWGREPLAERLPCLQHRDEAPATTLSWGGAGQRPPTLGVRTEARSAEVGVGLWPGTLAATPLLTSSWGLWLRPQPLRPCGCPPCEGSPGCTWGLRVHLPAPACSCLPEEMCTASERGEQGTVPEANSPQPSARPALASVSADVPRRLVAGLTLWFRYVRTAREFCWAKERG